MKTTDKDIDHRDIAIAEAKRRAWVLAAKAAMQLDKTRGTGHWSHWSHGTVHFADPPHVLAVYEPQRAVKTGLRPLIARIDTKEHIADWRPDMEEAFKKEVLPRFEQLRALRKSWHTHLAAVVDGAASRTVYAKLLSVAPTGYPRHVRCYDNGGTSADRWTAVFTGRHAEGCYLGMSSHPFHPQGIGIHGQADRGRGQYPIDRPKSSHLGTAIPFEALPWDCQRCVWQDYLLFETPTKTAKDINAGIHIMLNALKAAK